ncbi:ATP-grasp domain-containing protein [Amycolatopsis anabasis]|uniref:ATP-grasp domain-containing protein n=1 Tax=Amycolatopsis anabasis TaxID=1840409 RepID=UPI00131E9EA8|nr:glutathione synthase [Amycolatopsis anabasis]
MTYRVLVLISRLNEYRLDNHSILPNALLREGHEVCVGDIETLGIADSDVVCEMFTLDREYETGVPFPDMKLRRSSAEDFDLVWVLTNPHPNLLIETYELLWVLNQRVAFVNAAVPMLMLNSKITLPSVIDRRHLPDQYVANSFDRLNDVVVSDAETSWILKPANEGCGADVYFVNARERNCRALLQSATGNETTRYEMYGRPTIGLSRKYVTMQRFVPNVVDNEKRVMMSGGVPFCGFRRFHHDEDHRANVTLGNAFEGLSLNEEEDAYCRHLGEVLIRHGIYFAGIDLAYPYVLELNLANPGGLNYSFRATGVDQSAEAVTLLFAALERDGVIGASVSGQPPAGKINV